MSRTSTFNRRDFLVLLGGVPMTIMALRGGGYFLDLEKRRRSIPRVLEARLEYSPPLKVWANEEHIFLLKFESFQEDFRFARSVVFMDYCGPRGRVQHVKKSDWSDMVCPRGGSIEFGYKVTFADHDVSVDSVLVNIEEAANV